MDATTTDASAPLDTSAAADVTSTAVCPATPSSAWPPHEHESWRRTKLTSLKGNEYEALRREEAAKATLVDALAAAVEVSPLVPFV